MQYTETGEKEREGSRRKRTRRFKEKKNKKVQSTSNMSIRKNRELAQNLDDRF